MKGIGMLKKSAAAIGLALLISNPGLAQSIKASNSETAGTPQTNQGQRQPSAKNFDIFGINAQQSYGGEFLIGGKKCKISGSGQENCMHFTGPQISTVPTTSFGVFFNNGKVYSIHGASLGSNFRLVSEAFEAKYGKPFKVEDEEWKNRAGATFNNVKMTWEFDDGVLMLNSRGRRIDEMQFIFVSLDNAPKRDAPKVNF